MILHFVIIFSFGVQSIVRGGSIDNISIESVLDQVAIPTKIIEEFLQKPSKYSTINKLTTNEPLDSSTVHYENSNGFVPLIPASQQRYDAQQNENEPILVDENNNVTDSNKVDNPEDDASFLSRARHFLNLPTPDHNRRSFDDNENRDEFELLKVNNDTPAVANYGLFNDNAKHVSKSVPYRLDENSRKSLRNKNKERGKRVQNYDNSYDNARDRSVQYNHAEGVEVKKNIERTKSYEQDTSKLYRSEKTALPQTNYATVTTSKSRSQLSNKERPEQYRFKSPIMVEPSKYKIDVQVSGQSIQAAVSTSSPHVDADNQLKLLQSEKTEPDKFIQHEETSRIYDYADSRDFSDENADNVEEIEKPRRTQKTNRRPYNFDSSRKLPKEHRDLYDDVYDDQGRKRTKSKLNNRVKTRPVEIINEDDQYSDDNLDENRSNQNTQDNNWTQVAPNVEVSHSNGFEVDQIEKPKLHIVPVNILSNFDHATALDNSQGFDITNAMITGFVHDGSLSTAAPLVSSSQSYIDQNFLHSSSPKTPKTSVPDVIVGQSSYNNPVQAVLMPNQLQQNLFNQYMHSTGAPAVFAVTPSSNFIASSSISPSLQQMLNQAHSSLSMNQPSKPASFGSNPTNSNSNSGHRHKSNSHYNVKSTTSRPRSDRDDSRLKKKFNHHNNGQFLASASLSVDQDVHRHSNNKNNNKRNRGNSHNNHNDNQNSHSQSSNQITNQNFKALVQPTMIPAVIHTGFGLLNGQNQFVPNSILIANTQHNSQVFKSNGDNIGGASTNSNSINNLLNPLQKAQLPILGAKNVEIINPNINGNENINTFALNQIPAALVTTPIPIFTTTGFIASKQFSTTTDTSGAEGTFYNPISFVPSYDLMKSQSILNTNAVPNEQYSQQNLNLVSLLPGGNFYKHTPGAQIDLASKPKLTSDLEKYAEEMFKESLRTIYNSHKWNNDASTAANISLVDDSEIAKLRNELLRIKSKIRDSKVPKDILEAHHTETRFRTAKPGSDYKRPDSSIEQSHKNHHKDRSKPHHHLHNHNNYRPKSELSEILTPPKPNSFMSKSPFHDKPSKTRPAHGPRPNFNHETSRPRPRQGIAPFKPLSPEVQASSVVDYRYPVRPHPEKTHYGALDFRRSQPYNNYPTFTTSFPENDPFKASAEYRSSEKDFYNSNNQRTHNLMGFLMKNKQLPVGNKDNFYTGRYTANKFSNEGNQRTQSQA